MLGSPTRIVPLPSAAMTMVWSGVKTTLGGAFGGGGAALLVWVDEPLLLPEEVLLLEELLVDDWHCGEVASAVRTTSWPAPPR